MAELGYNESMTEVVRGIFADVRELIHQELMLARAEIREQAGRARLTAVALGSAIAALVVGAVFLLVAIAIGIADLLEWPVWVGFLILALLLSLAGAVMLAIGRNRLRSVHAVPEQTVQTLKENSEWIAKRLSSVRK